MSYLSWCRKRDRKAAHAFTDAGVSLCGLRLGLEPDWPHEPGAARCRRCTSIRENRREWESKPTPEDAFSE